MSDTKPAAPLESISLIVPVRNEEASIGKLMDAILKQTQRPSEVVITDGGSTDRTKEIIREYQKSYPIPLFLVETEQAFPGRGRNLAIGQARNEWLACTDAGIMLRPNWLAELVATARHHPAAQVVYGRFEPIMDTYFTECAAITYVTPNPRPRSIASCLVRRAAWATAGGFREDLRSAEDLLFFRALDNENVQVAYSDAAYVEWELQRTIGDTFQRFSVYSRNGMKAGLGHDWQFNVVRLYLMMLVLAAGGFFLWPLFLAPVLILLLRSEKRIWRWYRAKAPGRILRELLNPVRIINVTWINLVIDIAAFYGLLQSFADRGQMPVGLPPHAPSSSD